MHLRARHWQFRAEWTFDERQAAFDRLLTADSVIITRNGRIWDRKTYLDRQKAGQDPTGITTELVHINNYGDTAVVIERSTMNLPAGKTVILGSDVLVKQGGWKFAFSHNVTESVAGKK